MAENHHSASNPPLGGRGIAVLAFLAALTIAFYWKLALTDQYVWFDHPDMAYLEIPRLEFQAREIHAGRFPLWDPHLWSGQPLIGQTQPGPLFPLNLLFFLLPLKDGYLRFSFLNWYWVAIHFLALLFFYLLARELRLSKASAVLAGCAFSYGGFIGSVAWLDVVNGAIWTPLIFLFVLRAARHERPWASSAFGGFFLGVAWLSGHHEIPILVSMAAGFTWLWLSWKEPARLRYAAAFFIVAGLIGAVQIVPAWEFARLSRRWVGLDSSVGWKDKISYSIHVIYSLPAKGLLATVLPNFGRFADASPFMGWIAAGLAGLGTAARWREPAVRWATALGAVSWLYAMGVQTPLNGVMYAVLPAVDKTRVPSRAILLVNLSLAVLAAYGLEAILTDTLLIWTKRLRWFFAGAGVVLLLIALPMTLAERNVDDRVYLAALVCLAASALLAAWQATALTRGITAVALLSLALVELTNGAPTLYPNRNDKNANRFAGALEQNHDVAAYLRSQPGPVRVVVDDQVIAMNFGDWHGIDMLHGYMAGVSTNLLRHELHTARTQAIFSVTHFAGKQADKPGQEEVFTGASGIKVFRNPSGLPRARLVHEALSVENDAYLRIAIQNPEVDLSRVALFVGEAPQLERCEDRPERIEWKSRTSDRLILETDSACRGLLVVSETMFPGWEAKVDGRRERLWEAYGVFRGVVVGAGRRRIEMRYRPRSVFLGAGLTLIGLLLVAAAWGTGLDRSSRPSYLRNHANG